MADITINYKGESIATMDASGTKTLLTEGKYCEDDIEVAYVKPGGITTPAGLEIGTFTVLSDTYTIDISHSFGHVPKYAAVICAFPGEWTSMTANSILIEILRADVNDGTYSSGIIYGYNSNSPDWYSTNPYTTYPPAMTSSIVTFVTGRYYNLRFLPGYTYLYVIAG